MTAHPKVDPVSGEMRFFGYSPMAPYLRYSEVSASGELTHCVEIDIPAPIMMHDFVITENYSIFLDSPAVFDLSRLFAGGDPMSWCPENGTRLGVLPRGGSNADIRWFEIENCYSVHFFNAWEQGDTIEIRAPRMPDMPGGFNFENPGAARVPMPWRWVINLTTGAVIDEQTDDVAGEFPRVNESLVGQPTRFGYACPQRSWEFEFDFEGVVKYDFANGTSVGHYYERSQVSGEHVFAPDPDGTSEDDGWLMSFVTDRATEQSELVILDARDVAAGPVARVQMQARVPIGFHAAWFANPPALRQVRQCRDVLEARHREHLAALDVLSDGEDERADRRVLLGDAALDRRGVGPLHQSLGVLDVLEQRLAGHLGAFGQHHVREGGE
jgi:carotenoid cleavage dioxygenase-like enzyme